MSAIARTVLPTDLPALVTYDGRVYSNEAFTRDRIGTQDSPHPLEAAFEQWFSFATGRHTWISVKGPTLRGLVSARKRGSKLAWEVDCLIDAAEDDDGVLMSLLEQMTSAAGKSGALKIFLRLRAGSYSERAVTRCGFVSYARERLYRLAADSGHTADSVTAALRRREKTDIYAIFQLYNELIPAEVRRNEAVTFVEWTGMQERIGRTTQWVLLGDSSVRGSLRVAGDGDIGRFDLLGHADVIGTLIEAARIKLANRRAIYSLAGEHVPGLQEALEVAGFEPGDEYRVFARRTVRPVKLERVKPTLATTAFG